MKRGFTLIELLVVVSMITTLSSTIIVNVIKARESGYQSYSRQILRQFFQALYQAKNDNGEFPNPHIPGPSGYYCLGLPGCFVGIDTNPDINAVLSRYMSSFPAVNLHGIDVGFGGSALESGIRYSCNIDVNGKCTSIYMIWNLDGDAPCDLGANKTILLGDTRCLTNLLYDIPL